MKVIIIGGTGHIGSFVIPFLVQAGHEVVVVTSGRRPVPQTKDWKSVKMVKALYRRDDSGWRGTLAGLKPEIVVDILGADLETLYCTVRNSCRHLIVCGSIWMFGEPKTVPTPEETQSPCRFEEYARRYAEMLEVKKQAAEDGISFTAIMPPNICGPGKIPLDTMGGRDIKVHHALSRGEEIILPSPGSHLIGPCDAEDVAQGFALVVSKRDSADGEIFNVGSAYALTTKRFAEVYAEIYGVNIPIRWVNWQEYITNISPDPGAHYHFKLNMCPDISKISCKLGYQPKHTPEQTLTRAVDWMREQGLI